MIIVDIEGLFFFVGLCLVSIREFFRIDIGRGATTLSEGLWHNLSDLFLKEKFEILNLINVNCLKKLFNMEFVKVYHL